MDLKIHVRRNGIQLIAAVITDAWAFKHVGPISDKATVDDTSQRRQWRKFAGRHFSDDALWGAKLQNMSVSADPQGRQIATDRNRSFAKRLSEFRMD